MDKVDESLSPVDHGGAGAVGIERFFHVCPVGAYSHTAHGSDNPPFRWCTGASIAPAPASPSTASQLLITSKEGTARGVDLEQ